jgi:hypothetical protein
MCNEKLCFFQSFANISSSFSVKFKVSWSKNRKIKLIFLIAFAKKQHKLTQNPWKGLKIQPP